VLSITKQKHCKGYLWICKHREASYGVKILLKFLYDKGFHKWCIEPIGAPRIWKLMLGVKKLGKSDMDGFNSYEDQATYFKGLIKPQLQIVKL